MERALHDPESGYYARKIGAIGARGDFTTAPMLSDAPARAIAAWAAKALKETACMDLIEIGPGEGRLAAGVFASLPWLLRWRVRFHLVETSRPLAERQKALLGNKVRHHATMQEAMQHCGGRAIIYSNELVDAFPVRRFRKAADEWREMAVHFNPDGKPVESLRAPAPLPDSTGFADNHPEGQCVEVHESYRHYLEDWMPLWKAGRMLTIDYGADASQLYHRRPRGTLRGYLFQQVMEGLSIYENPGRQDITADVNFTDLANWSARWTRSSKLVDFGEFLAGHTAATTNADLALIDRHGAGGAFMVLEQQR